MSARRPSLRHGLEYGWWKSPDFWVVVLSALLLGLVGAFLFSAWFLGPQA